MDKTEFFTRFKSMSILLRFAPKEPEAPTVWFHAAKDLTDEQIINGFNRAKNELKDFPAWSEFRDLALNQANQSDEIDRITANVMRCLSQGGDYRSSLWVLDACGPAGYEAIGGQNGWYDIMSGIRRAPREDEIRRAVKANYVPPSQTPQLTSGPSQKLL